MAKKTATKKAANKAAKAPKAPKAPKQKKAPVEREVNNGITRPAAGTKTARVWEISEALGKKGTVSRGDVMEQCAKEDIPAATVATQFQRWRVFYNITERSPRAASEPKAPKAPRKKAPKAPASAAA